MADDDVLHAQLLQGGGVALAGVGALVGKVDVLRAKLDLAALERLSGGKEADGHGADDHFRAGAVFNGLQVLNQGLGFGGGLVHFPVASDHGSSHGVVLLS